MDLRKFAVFTLFIIISVTFCASELDIQAVPATIQVGLTTTLTINCSYTFDPLSDIALVVSLILSRSRGPNDTLVDLASVSTFDSNQVKELTFTNASFVGHVGTDLSFLVGSWYYPVHEDGEYTCQLNMLDKTGHPRRITKSVLVVNKDPDNGELVDKIRLLEQKIDKLAGKQCICSASVTAGSGIDTDLKARIERVEKILNPRNDLVALLEKEFFVASPERNGRNYYLSKSNGYSFAVDSAVCKLGGGYLAQIDDISEFSFLQEFLARNANFSGVKISFTDEGHEGHWTFLGGSRVFKRVSSIWSPGEPGNNTILNCASMHRDLKWMVKDVDCDNNKDYFLCELPVADRLF